MDGQLYTILVRRIDALERQVASLQTRPESPQWVSLPQAARYLKGQISEDSLRRKIAACVKLESFDLVPGRHYTASAGAIRTQYRVNLPEIEAWLIARSIQA